MCCVPLILSQIAFLETLVTRKNGVRIIDQPHSGYGLSQVDRLIVLLESHVCHVPSFPVSTLRDTSHLKVST